MGKRANLINFKDYRFELQHLELFSFFTCINKVFYTQNLKGFLCSFSMYLGFSKIWSFFPSSYAWGILVGNLLIYRYGEGWDFGEVAKNGRGINASQFNICGTGIGRYF